MALRTMLVLMFVVSVFSVAAESTADCQASGSCTSNTGGLSMIQFRQDSAKARTETEITDDDDDDDEDEEEDEEEDEDQEEDEEDEGDEEGEKPTAKPGKGGKGKDFIKKLVAACEDKEAEAACSYEGMDGEAKEGTCVAKKETLWCKASGGKPGKGGKGAGKDEWIKKVVAACKEKEADAACSFEGMDGETKEGTCVAKKETLWCKAAGGKPGKGGKGAGEGEPGTPGKGGKGAGKDEWMKKVVAACKEKKADDACSFEGMEGEAKEGTCVAKKETLWCKPAGGKPGKGGKGAGEGKPGKPGKGGSDGGEDKDEEEEEEEELEEDEDKETEESIGEEDNEDEEEEEE